MNISKIPLGKNAPHEVNVIIEIPAGGPPVKYEFDKDSGSLFVDRFMQCAMHYPAHYGFVPHTLSEDGDPVDALVLGSEALVPGCVIPARPIGVLVMEDEAGLDEKILMVPSSKLHPSFASIKSIHDVPKETLNKIKHFFEHYKDLEEGKWVKVKKWGETSEALEFIQAGIEKAKS